ncbi:MAG: gamma carbonic anhydrase family protein [Pseudomonadota bacterium]
MSLYALDGAAPDLPAEHWIAPTATLIGQVRLGEEASVWWNAVLRGDNDRIILGSGSNIQDNAVCHADPGVPLTIGAGVTVGHSAILHGCTVGDNCLIGMQAVVLNHATIGEDSIIGAGALVSEGKTIPPKSLAVGIPARVVRTLSPEEIDGIRKSAAGYRANWHRYRAGCKAI